MEPKDAWTEELSRLGLRPGILLLESSDDFQADFKAFFAALFDLMGPESTILSPAFFEKKALPPLCQFFSRRGGVQFSAHPSYPFMASGGRASLLLRDHSLRVPFGFDSPIGRAYRFGGQVLRIGTAPGPSAAIALAASMTIHPATCSRLGIEASLRQGLLAEGKLGDSPARLWNLAGFVNEASRLFCQERSFPRCQDPSCPHCGAVTAGGLHH